MKRFKTDISPKRTRGDAQSCQVVPDFSSSLDDPRERAEHINANHMELCRFSSRTDPGYVQVGGELSNLVENISLQKPELQQAIASESEGKA